MQSFADEASESIFCRGEETHNIDGIECCISDFSLEKCEELIELLPESARLSAITVQEKIDAGDYLRENGRQGAIPNCFWNALSFSSEELREDPKHMGRFHVMPNTLSENYHRLSGRSLELGDLIVFHHFTWMRIPVLNERGEMTRDKRWQEPHEGSDAGPAHAMIYLKDGYVFQKENERSKVFSIVSLRRARGVYAPGGPNVRGRIESHYYRAR